MKQVHHNHHNHLHPKKGPFPAEIGGNVAIMKFIWLRDYNNQSGSLVDLFTDPGIYGLECPTICVASVENKISGERM